ncbi:polymer-forming cytoskeletal protein [Polynucleobacter sp. MWH-UH2A]|jgi:cytoskeletal protein CcmA (bactofilin family)|uniref:bactofilin family protein n=1 Tax=Polynucleobacter sp. MWH-UH2A TaxID=1855617 RepID=UPI001BFE7CF3|nr:polymer-forming cytoskeletal protein [Polynucleobacter sp. MWH-UH2A]QWD64667.1 polymer-forming cytoskeletal protein [Polynucleobacter sp. MWH-UH2A]
MSIFSKNTPATENESSASNEEVVQEYVAPEEVVSSASSPEQVTRLESPARSSVLSKPSIISEGFTFEGTITSDGVLNIAGTVRGKITAKSVLIDSSGQVDGELNSEQLVIKGQLKGDVNCEDLNVGPLAYVDGNISYKYIHIQRGGKVAGKFIKS